MQENSNKLNKFLHCEVNKLIQHRIIGSWDVKNGEEWLRAVEILDCRADDEQIGLFESLIFRLYNSVGM